MQNITSSSIWCDVYELTFSIMKVADMNDSGPADMIHAAAATWSWRWRDPLLPIMSCSVVGLVSVLLMRWPGGGFLLLVESDRFIGRCVQTFIPTCWYAIGWLSKGISCTVPVER